MTQATMENLVSLCKRRGFIFPSSDIYGGLQGIYDFGPLGVELKNNLKAAWWRSTVYERDDVEGLDAAILTNPLTLKHSGHEDTFTDPLIDCRACKARHRADHLDSQKCPTCGSTDLTDAREFNLMFKTSVGPVDDGSSFAYLRPETAQAIFTNFKHVVDSTSRRLPFGIAQMGKAFRNEITPRNFVFRVREFEQMELEFFVKPGQDEEWHKKWIDFRLGWWRDQGVSPDNIELYNVPDNELAHYSKATVDLMYRFPHGLEELEGIANRTDFDLGSHTKSQQEFDIQAQIQANRDSKTKLAIQDIENNNQWIIPYVIEPSAGVERGMLAILNEAYTEEQIDGSKKRVVLALKPHLAPIKAAILPLKRNNKAIVTKALEIKKTLQALGIGRMLFEDTGNIGKGYRRHDEIGTPMCITVDFETIETDDTVTVRDRDSMKQTRMRTEELSEFMLEYYR
tara:strand:- start:89 stop:1453 length:1365 start_codon:yes stop_codon:yes gene_type:complete